MESQITTQERHNIDLAASNTSLRKTTTELGNFKKELSAKVVDLKSNNEELEDKNVELV